MNTWIKTAGLALLSLISFASCSKKEEPAPVPANANGQVYLEFFNMAGSSNINLNSQWYKNENGDSFTVSKINYYISNIVLIGDKEYTEANSYHLMEQNATTSAGSFSLKDVPAGSYHSIRFVIGVDSLRNVSGVQSGDLDPGKGNFWSWSSGYIMLKFEGKSPKSPNPDGMLMLHCGGFSGSNNVLKTVTLSFPSPISVSAKAEPHVHLEADILKMFAAPNKIDFAKTSIIHMPGADARRLSDNYATMFRISYAGL